MSRHPLHDAWLRARAAQARPLQIPGHKGRFARDGYVFGAGLLRDVVRDDIALQGGVDDNALSHHYLEQAEQLWAEAVGAVHSRFLVGGSSQGNIAALSAVCRPERPVAVDRTSHRSAHAALVITGARPEWIYPQLHPDFHIPVGMAPAGLLHASSKVTAFFVTSPSYVGTITDVGALARVARERGVPLVVDQAWGAHLDFLPGRGAVALGADVSITSVHKALMGYSQTAVISLRDESLTRAHLDRCVDLVATTSPSGTLLASIDATRAVLEDDAGATLNRTIDAVAAVRSRLARVPGLVVLDESMIVLDESMVGCEVDPFKVTLVLPRTGVSGLLLGEHLRNHGHGPESADEDTLVLTFTVMDEPAFVAQIGESVAAMIESLRGEPKAGRPAAVWDVAPEVVCTPREAFFARRRRLRLLDAVGQVSAEQFCPYPPGVPLLAPGERVTIELVDAIRAAGRGGRVAYCSDPTLETIEVIDEV